MTPARYFAGQFFASQYWPVGLKKPAPKKMTIKNTSTIAALGITRRKS